jgi:hypothetical protein
MSKRTSTNSDRNPYERTSFWINSSNHFWETDMYSDKSKEYFRDWLSEMIERERKYSSL